MKSRVWLGIGLLGLGAFIGAQAWGADKDPFEKPANTVNSTATTSAGSQQVAGKIADQLNAACACSTFSASSVMDQRAETGWGWGSVLIADLLALAISQQSQIPFETALNQVTTARQQGGGWGAIAKANGLNVGKAVSEAVKSANAVAAGASSSAKGQKQGDLSGPGQHGGGQGHAAAGAGGGHGGGGGQGGGGRGGGDAGGGGGGGGGGKK
jgi:hypothetical protein